MINFDFAVDEQVLTEDIRADVASANAAALQETYFEMPVRISIEGVELLEVEGATSSPWLPLPLLDVALMIPELLDGLSTHGEATYSLPGGDWSLRMRRPDSHLEIESTVNGRRVQVPYKEIRAAAMMFRERVRSLIKQRVPELLAHEVWGAWLQSGRD